MPDEQLSLLDKLHPIILIAAVVIGIVFGSIYLGFSKYSDSILYFALIALVYSVMLGVPFGKIMGSYKNIRFLSLTWFANFIIIPIIAWILALIFLKDNPAIFIGFILYLVTPCTDWFLVFTSLAKGDVPLGLALLPTNLILQILLIPVYLLLFAGKLIPFQFSALIQTFLVFVLLPLILAVLTRWILRIIKTREWANKSINTILSPLQLLALIVVLFTMFAGQTTVILNNIRAWLLVFIPVIIFFILAFIMAQIFSRTFNLSYKENALFTCTTAARNSPLGLAIAFGLFPNQPLIQVAIIIGVLIELPILILVVRLLKMVRMRVYKQEE
jgi:arsenite transporter